MRVLPVLLMAALSGLSGRADAAAKSVTLIGMTGAIGAPIADELEAGLGEMYQVVPGEVYVRTAARLERSGGSVEEVQAVASQLRIDAVIAGSISRDARGRQLLVTVHAGASGRVIARGRYDLAAHPLKQVCDRVVADLVRALEHVSSAPAAKIAAAPAPAVVPAVARTAVAHSGDDQCDDDDGCPQLRRAVARPAPAPRRAPPAVRDDDDDDDAPPAPRPAPRRAAAPRPAPVVEEED
jgi:hypothetical protein